MARLCRHCRMESTGDQICSWCGKSLTAESPLPQQPAPTDKPSPGAAPGAPHQGAAAALMAAETARQATPQWPRYLAYAGTTVLIIVGWSAVAAKVASKPPQEPGEWRAVSSENEYLSLSVPDNWQFTTSGSRGSFEWVRVRSGKLCRVEIKGTQALGALADGTAGTAQREASAPDGGGTPFEETAVGEFHARLGLWVEERDRHYEEQGEMQPCTFAGSRAAYSTYNTIKRFGVFGVKVKGWRITTLALGPYAYQIRCECPERHWDQFQEIASSVLGGVAVGR